jgi:hypothetical protein
MAGPLVGDGSACPRRHVLARELGGWKALGVDGLIQSGKMVLMKLAMQQQHCRSSCESCLAKGPALAKGGTMMHCPDVAGTFLGALWFIFGDQKAQ